MSRQAHDRRSKMDEFESLSHSKWECKYHVVSIPIRHPEEEDMRLDQMRLWS